MVVHGEDQLWRHLVESPQGPVQSLVRRESPREDLAIAVAVGNRWYPLWAVHLRPSVEQVRALYDIDDSVVIWEGDTGMVDPSSSWTAVVGTMHEGHFDWW